MRIANTRGTILCGILVGSGLVLTGCLPNSLLITPVNVRQALVETELSRDSYFAGDKIALIDVSGLLVNQPRPGLLSAGEHPVSLFLEQLDKARRDPRVKAVLLRINSPGGTVVASELMHAEIVEFKKSGKPIVALMMDVAASGAYYIACACDEIIAQPSTITGSIGVIMRLFDVSGTLTMLGVTTDAIISGEHKDSGSPFRTMRPEERQLFQRIVDDMYERFVAVVVAGRPRLDEETVRRLADGRVYAATDALSEGLVDRIASMRQALAHVKELAGGRSVRWVTYNRPLAYRPNYYAQAPSTGMAGTGLLNVDPTAWLDRATPRFLYLWTLGGP